ncbi:rho guanine nucleotide exchange factor 17-like [Melanerpes formicivorus]|uniref:rho guanine nucleotide exchange factor 17-like n=1 Tax=Melanerpes formicivorus TaxID=211600 RepID=UPI00358ED242
MKMRSRMQVLGADAWVQASYRTCKSLLEVVKARLCFEQAFEDAKKKLVLQCDARLCFEQAFEDAKKKLASSKNCLDPEFLKAIPTMKMRSGMQALGAGAWVQASYRTSTVPLTLKMALFMAISIKVFQVEPATQMCYASLDHSVKGKRRKPRRRQSPSLQGDEEERSSNHTTRASKACIYLNSEQLAAENTGNVEAIHDDPIRLMSLIHTAKGENI